MNIRKRKVSMIKMFIIVSTVVIIASLLIVGFTYQFLWEFGILAFDANNPIAGIIPLLALSTVASILFSFIIGVTILRPMRAFQQAFSVVSEGDLDYRLNIKTNVLEVEQMRNGFNNMVSDLSLIETLSSDFIANVSHEFKTPLSSIEAYAVLLQNEDVNLEQRIEYLNSMRKSAHDLSILTDNILKLSRLDHNVYETVKKEYRLDEQIRHVILLNEKSWIDKNIDFDLHLDSIVFNGNQNMTAQIWQNLIDNAIKFSHKNGMVKISLSEQSNVVTFVIEDYGIGIVLADLNRIFDKFFQGDTSRKSSGNGLGLSLVKRIVDLHDGQLSIDSKEKEKTTVTVTLLNHS